MNKILLSQLGVENPLYRTGATCDVCKRVIPPAEYIRHCQFCRFDVCCNCWNVTIRTCCQQCPKGHWYREVSLAQLGNEIPAYRRGARCDRCKYNIRSHEYLRHCDTCQYDLCTDCWDLEIPGGLPAPMPGPMPMPMPGGGMPPPPMPMPGGGMPPPPPPMPMPGGMPGTMCEPCPMPGTMR